MTFLADEQFHSEYQGIVGQCGHLVGEASELFEEYFNSQGQQKCSAPACGAPLNLWSAVRGCFLSAGAAFQLLAPFGGRTLIKAIRIQPGRFYNVNLDELGVAPDDIVRGVNLTGVVKEIGPTVLPALMLGNQLKLPVHLPHRLTLFGVDKNGEAPVTDEGLFQMHVQFVPKQESAHRQLLLDGAIALGEGDLRRGVIDAHTAADIALDAFATQTLQQMTPFGEPRLGFLEKVGVLMLTRAGAGHPPVPGYLLDTLQVLNRQRNQSVHPSRSKKPLTSEVAADCLAASIFLVHLVDASGDGTLARPGTTPSRRSSVT
ncbi:MULTISPECIES: hypothetical protein [unclassified Arthrobacter]|uniref:hypothetical protein n=1 Tax=unclassified Arthrobacter TaxID=235627 RepID=UPI001C856C6A|nr:hypothetical protein [Arthrobacter sp. MAHUQ-56]MBX7443371.1 hypothetical protein [Arthrobacter sp. MAHUQ-56]